MGTFIKNTATMVRLSWEADAPRTLVTMFCTILAPVAASFQAVGIATIAEGVALSERSQAVRGVLLLVSLSALRRLLEWSALTVRMHLREHTIRLLDERVMTIVSGIRGIEHHERPDYQDRMQLLRGNRGALVNPLSPIVFTVASFAQCAVATAVLAQVHMLMFVLPLAALPSLYAARLGERLKRNRRRDQAEPARAMAHLFDVATLPNAAKEVRIFGLAGELQRRYHYIFSKSDRQLVRIGRRSTALTVAAWTIYSSVYGGAVWFALTEAVEGMASIGDVVLVLTIGSQINGHISILVGNAAWFSRNSEAASNYRWLLNHAARASAGSAASLARRPPSRLTSGIKTCNLGFRYHGADILALSSVSLSMSAGSTVALVGDNGAGKSTLVKLLLGLYDPTFGRIEVDGVDLNDLAVDEWRLGTSVTFQDFVRFHLVAREAVGIGSLQKMGVGSWIDDALRRGGVDGLLAELPVGLDTQLGSEFDNGVDLSLGQWQKIALGRAMMRRAPLLFVLDEPSSSLDATAEEALFSAVASQALSTRSVSGGITVLISHRLSTVRMADHIVVLHRGRVREQGRHDELLARHGLYHELYQLQAGAYR